VLRVVQGCADNAAIREAASGDRPIRKLFSKEQRAFYEAHAPDGIELDTLSTWARSRSSR
jgi:hypothetical protein